MKKKIIFAGLLAAVMTMMTSCLVIFPDEYYEDDYSYSYNYGNYTGKVVISNSSKEVAWISEVDYGNYTTQDWIWAWDDGHKYDYRSASNGSIYYGGTTDRVSCEMPVGVRDIRVTVVFKEPCGGYTYEDRYFINQKVTSSGTLYLNMTDCSQSSGKNYPM